MFGIRFAEAGGKLTLAPLFREGGFRGLNFISCDSWVPEDMWRLNPPGAFYPNHRVGEGKEAERCERFKLFFHVQVVSMKSESERSFPLVCRGR